MVSQAQPRETVVRHLQRLQSGLRLSQALPREAAVVVVARRQQSWLL
jgi:hypothetical protein